MARRGEWRELSHHAFDRTSLHRRVVRGEADGCYNCGNTNQHGNLFEYAVAKDDRPSDKRPIKGLFCCVDCMRAYN